MGWYRSTPATEFLWPGRSQAFGISERIGRTDSRTFPSILSGENRLGDFVGNHLRSIPIRYRYASLTGFKRINGPLEHS